MALRFNDWSYKKEKRRNGKVTRKHLSRYVIYFLCTIYLSRPILHASSFIPSTPFAICFFNGLLLATNVRVIAVSIYMRVYTFNTICLPIALHHVHFLSSRHLITGTLVLIHLRWYPFSTVLHCEKNIVSEIKEKRKKEKDEK